jgi:hypothetical protein
MKVLVPPPGGVTRLEADMATERRIALVKAAIGLALLGCSAWLFALPDMLPRAFGVIALVYASLWIVRAAKLMRQDNAPQEKDYLELGHAALKVREHGRELVLPWAEIVRVAIDHDRLTVALLRSTGEIVNIEPRYMGVTLEDLCEAVRALHSSAQSEGASPETGG